MRVVQFLLVSAVLLVSLFLTSPDRAARALPPAGSDRLPVVATVDIASRLGDATVVLTGWAQIERQAPHDEGGVDVVDLEIVSMDLIGTSPIGTITVRERPNSGPDYVSSGEIRSKQSGQDFPASSFFDLFVEVIVPAAPGDSLEAHNEAPLHLTAREGSAEVNLAAWPPLGVIYQLEPIYGVDNDGDGSIDEDTADEDGDGLIDEDRPGADPDTPGSGSECGFNADCDNQEGEDPPLSWCIANSSTICDDDGDGQMDEDPSCIPLMNPGNVNNMKSGFCVRDLTLEIAPELPSFSVAPGGPSGLHPADILALTPGDSGEPPCPPTPVAVSGNDDFANAWAIPSIPCIGEQITVGATLEAGEPAPCGLKAATVWFQFTPGQSGTIVVDTIGSGYDTVLAAYTGSALNALTQVACNDDKAFPSLHSQVSFPVTGGTTYRIQAGGYFGATGALVLNVSGSGLPAGSQAPFVRIPCANLGLTAGGCDSAGSVDDLNALSYGDDLPVGAKVETNFSVGPGAQGTSGSAVEVQRNCPAPEPEPDVFGARMNGTNTQELDGNGPIGACVGAFPLGLVEGASVRDDLNALYGEDPVVVDTDLDGVPDQAVYFSLGANSPSLAGYGFSAADVLRTVDGAVPKVYAAAAALGLEAGDDIDALCLDESGDGAYGAGDLLYFSLAPGSTTLGQIGAGPGDVLGPGSPSPSLFQSAASLGLLAGDDVDAVKCLAFKDPDGDTDGDTIVNSIDEDDDNDGCLDVQEALPTQSLGGRRNPHIFWDFLDVPTASGRDRRIDGFDIGAVVLRFGTFVEPAPAKEEAFAQALMPPPDLTSYHPAFDRASPVLGENVWNVRPPDGRIEGFDISFVVVQFGHTCA